MLVLLYIIPLGGIHVCLRLDRDGDATRSAAAALRDVALRGGFKVVLKVPGQTRPD